MPLKLDKIIDLDIGCVKLASLEPIKQYNRWQGLTFPAGGGNQKFTRSS